MFYFFFSFVLKFIRDFKFVFFLYEKFNNTHQPAGKFSFQCLFLNADNKWEKVPYPSPFDRVLCGIYKEHPAFQASTPTAQCFPKYRLLPHSRHTMYCDSCYSLSQLQSLQTDLNAHCCSYFVAGLSVNSLHLRYHVTQQND
jgi:hypothetical protein